MLSAGLCSGRLRRQPLGKAARAVWWFTAPCWSFLLRCGRSRPRQKSRRAALAQAAVSPNRSGGCICMAWGKGTALAPANPRQPTLTSPPCATWVTGRLSLLLHTLANIQGAESYPVPGKTHDSTKCMPDVLWFIVRAMGGSQKHWESESCFLLMSYRTWELRSETSANSQWNWSS